MQISYAITVCNEAQELDRLVSFLIKHKRDEDEIVVQSDEGNTTPEVHLVLNNHDDVIKVIEFPLNKDFASFKNNLKDNCTGDYIFQIDADEYPDPDLVATLPWILKENPDTEVYWVPRINIVNGIRAEHLQQWGWRMDADNRINFPDYQCRIVKNVDRIKWINKVHEIIIGQTSEAKLPTNDMYCLQHPKSIDRQEEQNNFYNTL
jgi:glycosyltransferase involved in cell wall biosynthesis